MNEHDQTADFDHGISVRLAGVILFLLVGIFVLQRLGFRFVMSARVAP